MKYVMFKTRLGECDALMPVIFPNTISHVDVAEAIQGMAGMSKAEVASAGFINLRAISCHGESETLELQSEPGDLTVINTNDYFHGLNHDHAAAAILKKHNSKS